MRRYVYVYVYVYIYICLYIYIYMYIYIYFYINIYIQNNVNEKWKIELKWVILFFLSKQQLNRFVLDLNGSVDLRTDSLAFKSTETYQLEAKIWPNKVFMAVILDLCK